MLQRATYSIYKGKNTSYTNTKICEEWLTFSNFVRWVDSQPNKNWVNCELDKDFIVEGNNLYHPAFCCFISKKLNLFHTTKRGKYLTGTYKRTKNSKFYASCRSIYTGKREILGYFNTELEAHKAWQAKKHEYACILAEQQQDLRVAEALRDRFSPDKDWTNV